MSPFTWKKLSAALCMSLGALSACSSDGVTRPGVGAKEPAFDSTEILSVQISHAADRDLSSFDTMTVTADVRDYRGEPVSTGVVAWTGYPNTPTGPRTTLLVQLSTSQIITASIVRKDGGTVEARLTVPAKPVLPVLVAAFMWSREEGFIPIPAPTGTRVAHVSAINDAGQVAGSSDGEFPSSRRAFVWSRAEGTRSLGALADSGFSGAYAISASGAITGYSGEDAQHHSAIFAWTQPRGMISIVTASPGEFASGYGINSAGTVVGEVDQRAVIAGPATGVRFLESRGQSEAVAVNDAGEAIGYDGLWSDDAHGLFWKTDGSRIDFGHHCGVFGLNGQGEALGSCKNVPFVWSVKNGFEDRPGLDRLEWVIAINDSSEVLGVLSGNYVILHRDGAVDKLPIPRENVVTAFNNRDQVVGYSIVVQPSNQH